jgi:DNA-binding LacI/PurR family transcriptional regulator
MRVTDAGTSSAPTLEDVARVAGVSRASVSRVVNGKDGIAPRIVEAVRRAVEETGYVPNAAARSLVTKQTGSIAIVVSGVDVSDEGQPGDVYSDPFFGRLTSALVRSLAPRDVHPILMIAQTEAERGRVQAFLERRGADGALMISTDAQDPLPEQLYKAHQHVVVFARPTSGLPMSFVDLAHREGAKLAADRLVEIGRKRVGMISGPIDVPAASDRMLGFRDAMARHGRGFVPVEEGNFTVESGEAAMVRLLEQDPDLDGIFAANDLMAIGAMHALADAGRSVPGDVAVVGFDDALPGRLSRPKLTTVRQPLEEMADAMVDLLVSELRSPAPEATSRIFEPTLVLRGSA